MFTFTLTITEILTGKIVHSEVYTNTSNTSMMDTMKHLYRTLWPRDKYRIDW